MLQFIAISSHNPMGNVCVGCVGSCRCKGCARLRCSNCCVGFRSCCIGFRSCIGARKSIRSICPLWRRHKGGTREIKAETRVAITNGNQADPPYVQRKPPELERIVKEHPRPSRPTSPVETIRKPVAASSPTKDRTKEVVPTERPWEVAITPMVVPAAPKERTRENIITPVVSPIPTTSPNITTHVVEPTHAEPAQNTRPRPSGEANKQGSPGRTKKPHNVKRRASAGLQARSVLHTKTGHLKEYYTLGQKLGQGQFGITFHCVEKGTGKEYACKSIAKRKLVTKEDVEDVKREIQIMHHMSGHPNVIKIKGAYEDAVAVHVVMELCKGGELFDRIVERGHYTERKAAKLSRVIVGVVQVCHSLGVMHRDLKPENFLFASEEEESPLKTIDFGLSIFFKPGDTFKDVVGSPYYVAPEVLLKKYGMEADVWSAGIIIYILLCGVPPFWAESEQDIFQEVLHGELDFSVDPWPTISESAKDLIRKMLVRNPQKRITAHEVLCHPWIQVDGVAPDKPLDSAVLVRLKKFCAMNKLKKMALRIIAEKLSEDEIAGLKEMFKMIDTDNSGQITFEELKAGLQRFGANLDDTEMYSLMRAADIDNSGAIDYGEFIAATLHLNKVEREDCLFAAFSFFDKDGSGYITQDELQKACEQFGIKDSRLEEMIQEVDQDNDGRIDYNEFVAMMQNGNSDSGKKDGPAG